MPLANPMSAAAPSRISEALSAGWTIVAASDRLARDIRIRFSLNQRAAGKRGWLTPDIPSLQRWISASWLSTWPIEQVLHPAQELSLWLYAVESSEAGSHILNKTGAARAARSAWRLAERHGITVQMLQRPHAGDDESAFLEWRQIVAGKEQERGWITQEGIAWRLTEAVKRGLWKAPEKLAVVGLLEPTGGQRAFFEAVAAAGSQVRYLDVLEPHKAHLSVHRVRDRAEQYRHVACLMRERLLAVRDINDTPRLAIVVPDASEARPIIEATLREYLAPQSSLPGPNAGKRPWRYSRGDDLASHPMVSAALDALSLQSGMSGLPEISRVLLTPWLFRDVKDVHRAEMDLALRSAGGTRFSHKRVSSIATHLLTRNSDNSFATKLAEWISVIDDAPREALPSEWATRWSRLLGAAQWGADEDAPPEIKSVYETWVEAIDAFRAMDSQVRRISQSRALVWLREVLSEKSVQASVDYLQPISILNYDHVHGMVFDYIAVCDASASVLPAAPKISGFISNEALKKAGVTEATPEGCLEQAKRWVKHLSRLATEVEVYCPDFDDRGAQLEPSNLFEGWHEVEAPVLTSQSALDRIIQHGVQSALPATDTATPVVDQVSEGIRGGSGILTDMIPSPFIAFARARLGLREFPEAVDGLDGRTQGIAVHGALEAVWKALKDSATLKATSKAALETLVLDCVSGACAKHDLISEARFGAGLVAAEEKRITDLVLRWLDLEARRAYEFRVLRMEARARALVSGLAVDLQIDRIDEVTLPDGSKRYLVIDYKTTGNKALSAKSWSMDSLSEPQLPLYATCATLHGQRIDRVDGIAFAQIHRDINRFICSTNFADSLVPNSKGVVGTGEDNWPMRLDEWRQSCEALAAMFMRGDISLYRNEFKKSPQGKKLASLARSAVASDDDEGGG